MALIKSFLLFILAGLFEIGGGYLIWQSLKNDKPIWWGIIGGIVLVLYGVVALGRQLTLDGYTRHMAASLLLWR